MKSTSFPFLLLVVATISCSHLFSDTFVSNGIVYRSVPEISSKLGMKLSINGNNQVTLRSKWSKVEFSRGSRIIKINDTKLYLGFPSIEKNKTLYIPELDWQFTLSPILLKPNLSANQKRIRTIVIDPGHGGKDPGAQNQGSNLNEKELTLDVAKQLEKDLEKEGFKVYLTRKNDKFIELVDRPTYARKRKADLFVSIHFNSSSNSSSNGIETYAYTLLNQPSSNRNALNTGDQVFRRANRSDNLNILVAYYVQSKLVQESNESDRGVKRARFTVLENLSCPGVLLELGFINNPATAKNLKNPDYLSKLSRAITSAILQYQQRIQS